MQSFCAILVVQYVVHCPSTFFSILIVSSRHYLDVQSEHSCVIYIGLYCVSYYVVFRILCDLLSLSFLVLYVMGQKLSQFILYSVIYIQLTNKHLK